MNRFIGFARGFAEASNNGLAPKLIEVRIIRRMISPRFKAVYSIWELLLQRLHIRVSILYYSFFKI